VVAVSEKAHRTRLPEQHVIVLQFDLIAVEFPEPEVDGLRIRVLRR